MTSSKLNERIHSFLSRKYFTLVNRTNQPIYCFISPDANDQELDKLKADPTASGPPTLAFGLDVELSWAAIKETEAQVLVLYPGEVQEIKLSFSRYRLAAGVVSKAINPTVQSEALKAATAFLTQITVGNINTQIIPTIAAIAAKEAAKYFCVGNILEPMDLQAAIIALQAKIQSSYPNEENDAVVRGVATAAVEAAYEADNSSPINVDLFYKNIMVGRKDVRVFEAKHLRDFVFFNVSVQSVSLAKQALESAVVKVPPATPTPTGNPVVVVPTNARVENMNSLVIS